MSNPNALTPFIPIVVDLDGTPYTLKRLSNYDRVTLLGKKYEKQRKQLLETLKEAGITKGAEYFQTVREFDTLERVVNAEWVDYCNDPLSDYDLILTSLLKTVSDRQEAERIAKEIYIPFNDKAYLCGLTMTEPEKTEPTDEEGTDPGEPQDRPLAYGSQQPGTTDEITLPNVST